MSKQVDIPVKVVGAEAAQQQLKGVAGGVRAVGAAGTQAAGGAGAAGQAVRGQGAAHEEAGKQTEQHGKSLKMFDRDAKQAAFGVLGLLNPALRGMADLTLDLAEGVRRLSAGFLRWIAIGAGVGGIVLFFQAASRYAAELAAKVEELEKKMDAARAKQREGAGEAVDKITAALQKEGAFTPAAARGGYGLYLRSMALGVPREAAAGLAGVGQAAGLSEADLALLAAAGIEPKDAVEAKRAVARLRSNPAALAEVQSQAALLPETRAGRAAQLEAALLRRQGGQEPRFGEELAGTSRDATLLAKGKELGLIPAETGVGAVQQFRITAKRENALRKIYELIDMFAPAAEVELARKKREQYAEFVAADQALEAAGTPPGGQPPHLEDRFVPAGAPERGRGGYSPGTRTIIHSVTNIGTHYGPLPNAKIAPDYVGEGDNW